MRKNMLFCGTLLLVLMLSSCAHNGDTRQSCINYEKEEYTSCRNVDGPCDEWATICNESGTSCWERCMSHVQVEVCKPDYRKVCTEWETRYYCEARKRWVSEQEFIRDCPKPVK